MNSRRDVALPLLLLVCAASTANAQAGGQLWGNFIVDLLPTSRLTYEIDLEPKAQLIVQHDQPRFGELKAVPAVTYALSRWVDVLGQAELVYQGQSNEENSMSMSPMFGAHLHILSQILRGAGGHGAENEKLTPRRADFAQLVRLEDVHTFYSTSKLQKTMWQLRDRFEASYALNRPTVTDDGALYVTSDAELFIPLNREVKGGAVNELRIRAGLGYRESFGWRYEVLYIWDGRRTAGTGVMAVDFHAIDIRIKREF